MNSDTQPPGDKGIDARIEGLERALDKEIARNEAFRDEIGKAKRQLSTIHSLAHLNYWRWSFAEQRLIETSESFQSLFSDSSGNVALDYDDLAKLYHPDDRQRVLDIYETADNNVADYEVEFRILTGAGSERHLREIGRVEYDEDGAAIGHIGTIQDISEQWRTEQELTRAHGELESRVEERTAQLEEEAVQRRRIMAALRSSEGRFRDFAESASDWYWETDKDLRFTYFSRRFREHLGVNPADYLGKRRDEIGADRENVMLWYAHYKDLEDQRPFRDFNYPIILPDGSKRFVSISGIPYYENNGDFAGYRGIGSDTTEKVEADRAVLQAQSLNARLGRIIDQSINEVFVFNAQTLKFIQVNRGARENLGYSLQELQKITPVDIKPEFGMAEFTELLAPLRDGDLQQCVFETVHRRKDGTTYDVEIHIQLMREESPPVYIAIIADITNRKLAEAQVIQSNKLATLGEMASGIAHEIAQPLNIIRISAEATLMEISKGQNETERMKEILSRIEGQATRMAEIIDHMRLFARTDTVGLETFDPANSIFGAIGLLAPQFASEGIHLEEDVPDESRLVLGSELQLEQVVMNLLANAKDAVRDKFRGMEDGTQRGTVGISLIDEPDTDTIGIYVTDNGGGIPEDIVDKLFDPFFTTKAGGKGTGLGLSISDGIIRAMGGKISIENTEDGSRFEIILPVSQDSEDMVEESASLSSPHEIERPQKSLRVLVVDDEMLAADGVANFLESMGHVVGTAANGIEALRYIESYPVDVVITDLRMPGMDGHALLKELQITDPSLPVFIVTGHTLIEDDNSILADGAVAIIKKPISLGDLAARLDGLAV